MAEMTDAEVAAVAKRMIDDVDRNVMMVMQKAAQAANVVGPSVRLAVVMSGATNVLNIVALEAMIARGIRLDPMKPIGLEDLMTAAILLARFASGHRGAVYDIAAAWADAGAEVDRLAQVRTQ